MNLVFLLVSACCSCVRLVISPALTVVLDDLAAVLSVVVGRPVDLDLDEGVNHLALLGVFRLGNLRPADDLNQVNQVNTHVR